MQPNLNFKETLKNQVNSILPGARVLLFGSRSRGDHKKGSDVDILVITQEEHTPKQKMNLESAINKVLVKTYHLPFDVLVYGETEIMKKRNEKSLVVYHAMAEGLELA